MFFELSITHLIAWIVSVFAAFLLWPFANWLLKKRYSIRYRQPLQTVLVATIEVLMTFTLAAGMVSLTVAMLPVLVPLFTFAGYQEFQERRGSVSSGG